MIAHRLYYDDEYEPPITSCPIGQILIDDECQAINQNDLNLFYFDNPYYCNNVSTCKIDYIYNDDYFTPYDYISIYKYDSISSPDKTLVATTTIENLNVFGKENGISYLTLTGFETDDMFTYYDITAYKEAYWSPTLGDVEATTTIPYMLVVSWGDYQLTPELEDFHNMSTTSANNILGLNTYSMACTQEDWASTSSIPFIGWNVDLTLCKTKKWFLDIALQPANWIDKTTKKASKEIVQIFPFNMVINIMSSWNKSATAELPTNLNWLDDEIDVNGNITITQPQFEGMATSTAIIFGAGTNNESEDYGNKIKSLSTYIMIGIFFWYSVVKRGIRIYEDVKEEI
jgi:hypothetical protein